MSATVATARPCRSCDVMVLDLRHERTGRHAPIEVEPVQGGNIAIDLEAGTYRLLLLSDIRVPGPRYRNHFAACPEALRFRGRRAR